MFNKKISDKEAEIKSLAKECEKTEFYDRIHYIHLKDKLSLDHIGLNIINHHFSDLDMFITDRLSDRKMSVKRVHTSQFKMDDQICKFVQDGRNVRAEILITSFCKEITPNQLLCKVQIEKLIDTDKSTDPFFIPLPHNIECDVNFEKDDFLTVTAPEDILLQAKTFHKQLCNVNIKDKVK